MPSSKVESPVQLNDLFDRSKHTTVKPELLESSQPGSRPPVPARNDVSDYLSKRCNILAEEENPFDSQFGGGPTKFEGNNAPGVNNLLPLPSFHALQSGSGGAFNKDGLRQGPLSPNMLAGPKKPASDYFSGEHGMGINMGINDGPRVFTPQESALRHQSLPSASAALSPGNPLMFPTSLLIPAMPSPGIFGGSVVATPGTAEFQRTATEIRERQLATIAQNNRASMQSITSQPQEMNEDDHHDLVDFNDDNQSNAATSLFLLANSGSSRDSSPHYNNIALGQPRQSLQAQAITTQQQVLQRNQQILNQQMSQQMNSVQGHGQMADQIAGQSNNSSSMNGHSTNQRTRNTSINSNSTDPESNGYENDMNGHGVQTTTGNKRASTKRKGNASKPSPKNNKKSKGNNAAAHQKQEELKHEEFTNEDLDNMEDQDLADFEENEERNDKGKSKKPETDDEKRKSFLERNRVAALKCRQRKKQWLNNLQAKVDTYTNENEHLQQKVQSMENEIHQLRTMLMAHKDTPLGQQQGLPAYVMPPLYEDQPHIHQAQNPYGMAGMHSSQSPNM
ncbi:hypothetical protein SBOR_9967 [Sclerotinia borealis F-4128]|uniref:BZIP domain-containing protein n=1 Tax=Sclerotinia borealis (strain F-4128) TaxID=1432307 RepID=W9BYH6_SCLBF|nr:hypothetical protein SBOR_9967 [Sclerotinia borealis F-4128]